MLCQCMYVRMHTNRQNDLMYGCICSWLSVCKSAMYRSVYVCINADTASEGVRPAENQMGRKATIRIDSGKKSRHCSKATFPYIHQWVHAYVSALMSTSMYERIMFIGMRMYKKIFDGLLHIQCYILGLRRPQEKLTCTQIKNVLNMSCVTS